MNLDAPFSKANSRPLKLADGVILIAAIAIGLCWVKVALEPLLSMAIANKNGNLLILYALTSLPFLLTVTVAIVPLRLVAPRPRRASMFAQPGMAAGVASAVAMIWVRLELALDAFYMRPNTSNHSYSGWAPQKLFDAEAGLFLLMNRIIPAVSFAVMISWVTLALLGQWKPERSWIDRLGRALGFFWVAGIPLFYYVSSRS